jgi:1,4-alpha-glucan branching enzyme
LTRPTRSRVTLDSGLIGDAEAATRLVEGRLREPQRVLGRHPGVIGGVPRSVLRALQPDAIAAEVRFEDGSHATLAASGLPGLFAGPVPELPLAYRLHFRFADGAVFEREDPYRFASTLGELDLHLFAEGTHRRLWQALGARVCEQEGVAGVQFAVWAPRAQRVSVVGDFCAWDGRRLPMRWAGGPGVFELFVPGVASGALYKFEILAPDGHLLLKTDPFAAAMELSPATASRVFETRFEWSDAGWLARRSDRDPRREPMAIYEVHLGSWARVPEEGNRALRYREIAPRLARHARSLGFTHLELLPIAEHPYDPSWGYQVSGYYAPTARYGDPDDFRAFVDVCHAEGLGVILDWVPAHFPRDAWGLPRFDGAPLFEYADPRLGEHPDWGTLVFDFGRPEVRNFLISNALYWLCEFHIDGLRVDAVASMLHRDYSRRPGEWLPNLHGGRENLEAVEFVKSLNVAVAHEHPGCFTVAEESTAWAGVTRAVADGGLGFTFKWNMGWMHDTLRYFSRNPIHRRFHQDELTFAQFYEHSERFIMPLSHDEVVHGKRSLLEKMPGDPWQKFANLRLLLAYQWTRPGKKLLFMGSELAPPGEWNFEQSLDWHLAEDPPRRGVARLLEALGRLYREHPCLWRVDPDPDGFVWIDCHDRLQSIVSYLRRDGADELLVVLNATPTPHPDYRIGAPAASAWRLCFSSDAHAFGGSGFAASERAVVEAVPFHGLAQSIRLSLPPLSALVYERERS